MTSRVSCRTDSGAHEVAESVCQALGAAGGLDPLCGEHMPLTLVSGGLTGRRSDRMLPRRVGGSDVRTSR